MKRKLLPNNDPRWVGLVNFLTITSAAVECGFSIAELIDVLRVAEKEAQQIKKEMARK